MTARSTADGEGPRFRAWSEDEEAASSGPCARGPLFCGVRPAPRRGRWCPPSSLTSASGVAGRSRAAASNTCLPPRGSAAPPNRAPHLAYPATLSSRPTFGPCVHRSIRFCEGGNGLAARGPGRRAGNSNTATLSIRPLSWITHGDGLRRAFEPDGCSSHGLGHRLQPCIRPPERDAGVSGPESSGSRENRCHRPQILKTLSRRSSRKMARGWSRTPLKVILPP